MSEIDRMKLQSDEFTAATKFGTAVRAHNMTAVVDDGYPEVRHQYESALAALISAMKANSRFVSGNRYGVVSPLAATLSPPYDHDRDKLQEHDRDKLQAFKDYTHGRLDAMGVPKAPESPHLDEGCRIGARLDYVESAIIRSQPQQAELERLRELAGCMYAGPAAVHSLPDAWLDVLLAASQGGPFSCEGLLPYEILAEPKATVGAEPAYGSISELIRSKVGFGSYKHRDEGETNEQIEVKIDDAINRMTNVQLLDHISDAITENGP